jgi:pimeloyl-ACP methyl ester carboxylesterase
MRGLGAALAASPSPRPEGAQRVDLIADDIQVPVSVLVVFDDLGRDVPTRTIHAHAEIHSLSDGDRAEVAGRQVPLEFAPTAALALMLAETQPWKGEIKALFQGDLARSTEGLIALGPHQPGRIPVVLVHGTASSVTTWANMLNDLMSKPDIQGSYEFYLFSYNTGAPIAYSAWLLRQAIQQMEQVLDPEGGDPAMRRMVVIGHSQGGLLTKLMAVDSGDRFWKTVSDVPFDQVKIKGEARRLVQGSLFVEPSPYVERVIFIATPHRGSYLMNYGPARLLKRFVRAPANVVNATRALVAASPEASAVARIDDVQGALGNMSPTSPFLADLVSLPVAPPIRANSIIAMRNVEDPKGEASDGVVQYESAHLDGVESEAVVESGHSCLANPMVIGEVTRILRMHRETGPRSAARAAVHELMGN